MTKPYVRKTHYYETDQMGIIHHSNYIRWFEEARIDFLNQIGLSYEEMEKRGILIPVLQVNCKYKKAFRYGDEFKICLKFQGFKGVKFKVSYEVFQVATGELHATGEAEQGFVNRSLIPVNIKKEHPDIYNAFVQGISEN